MPEVVILSGKGGTGKTTLTAALAALADGPVICDTDVDAANLHLLLHPQILEAHEFIGGSKAAIRAAECTECGLCLRHCRFQAIRPDFVVEEWACEGCKVCVQVCPEQAIDFDPVPVGEYFFSQTAYGPLIHGRLYPGGENSGKLVTMVRRRAQETAAQENRELILVDGPPGLGCPVIASLTGATHVLLVTEPTVSGQHDLQRLLDLIRSFKLPAAVIINRWDIRPEGTEAILNLCQSWGCRSWAASPGRPRCWPPI